MPTQRQIETNRRNWQQWRGASPEGRERIRQACLRDRPWEHSTGPRTEAGKRRVRTNAVVFGGRCETVEPYASGHRLRRAIRALRREHERQIRSLDDPLALLPHDPEADELSEACRRFCAAVGVPIADDQAVDTLAGVLDMMNAVHDVTTDIGVRVLTARLMIDLVRADDALLWARYRRCEALLSSPTVEQIEDLRGLLDE